MKGRIAAPLENKIEYIDRGQKNPLSVGRGFGPLSNYMYTHGFLSSPKSTLKHHLGGFIRFAQLTVVTDKQTDRRTDTLTDDATVWLTYSHTDRT